MHVEDRLAGVCIAVGHDPVPAFGHTQLGGQLARRLKYRADCGGLVRPDVVERGQVLSGNDQHVDRGCGVDVAKGQAIVVGMNDFRRDLAVADLAEETVGHEVHLLGFGLARRVSGGQARHISTILILALFCGLAGCSSITNPKDSDLAGVVKRFHHDLRWKIHQEAAARVNPEFRADFMDQIQDLKKDLNITDWDVRRVELDPDNKRAVIQVSISYYLMPSTVIREEKIEQVWMKLDDHWILMKIKGGPVEFLPQQEEDE